MDKQKQEKIIEKARMKIAISNFEKEEIKMDIEGNRIIKMVATFLLATGITGGLVFATGTIINEKIWKEPEICTYNRELTEEEKSKCISEQEAEDIANAYLNQIGLSEENINSLKLTKEYFEEEKIWDLRSDKVNLTIDAEKGIIRSAYIPPWEYKIPGKGITRAEARKIAIELLEKYKPEGDTGEYELVKLTRNMETDEASYIWHAVFHKKYGDLLNENEEIYIGWIPNVDGLYSVSFKRDVYENNEEKITKEEAIKIAEEKDKQIEKNKTIIGTKAEIRIRKMNAQVYLRENFKEEYENGTVYKMRNAFYKTQTGEISYETNGEFKYYKTEERVRKVWCVVIEYDMNKTLSSSAYTYYIDATTGEIIGGSRGNSLEVEKNMHDDPYNLIEK